MGKFIKGVLGGFSGKVGTVIGSSWNGIDYMRSLPRPSSKAPTDLQLIQRAKFGFANGFLGPVGSLINLGFRSQAVKKTGFNMAIAHVIAEALTGTYPDFDIDYTKVLFSKGPLEVVWNTVATSSEAGEITLAWQDNTGIGTAKATDKVVILIYNPSKSKFVYSIENGAARSAATTTLAVPDAFSGDTVQIWIATMTPDKATFSTSMHAGTIEVA
ncbi:MAG: DUF6266 family protein [Daejeonella sp.]